jgi:hypothetical protein
MFLFFGLIPFDPSIAPLIMLCIYFIFLSKNYFYSHINSILIGYLLVFNILTILPDNYWTVCFFIDLILILLLALLWKHRDNIGSDSSDILNQRNIHNSHDNNNNNNIRRTYRRRNSNRNILLNNNNANGDDDVDDTNIDNYNWRYNNNILNQFSSYTYNDNDDNDNNQLEVITYYCDDDYHDDNNNVDIESQQSNLQYDHNSIMTSSSINSSSSSHSVRNIATINNYIDQSSSISINNDIDDDNNSDNKSNNNNDDKIDDDENNDITINSTIISGNNNSRGRNIVTAVLRGNRKIRLPPYSLSAVYRKEEEAEIEEGLLHSK